MRFPYSSIISQAPGAQDFLLLRRPEIPITIKGPAGVATYLALVDTGSDNTIFPKTVAEYLSISLTEDLESESSVFGGYRVRLQTGDAILSLEDDNESITWKTSICFFDFSSTAEETIILGHAGCLDYFTATFDGRAGLLTLIANDDLPRVE